MSDRSIRSLALAFHRHRGAQVTPLSEDGSVYAIKRGEEPTMRVAFSPEAPAELPLFCASSPEWRAMVDELTAEVAVSYRYLVAGAITRPAAALQAALPEGWAVAHAELLGVTQRQALAVSHRVRFDAPALAAATEKLLHHVWQLDNGERSPELEAVWLDRPTLLIRPEAHPSPERVEALVAEGAGLADAFADAHGASLEQELVAAHEEALARAEAYFEQQITKVLGREKQLSAKLDAVVAKLAEAKGPEAAAKLRGEGAELEAQLAEAAARREAELHGLQAALAAKKEELAAAHELEAEVALVALAHLRDDRLSYRAELVSPSGAQLSLELGFWPVVGRLELPPCASCGEPHPTALLERGIGLVGCPACVEPQRPGTASCSSCQHPEPTEALVRCATTEVLLCAGCAVACASCGVVVAEAEAAIVGGVGYCLGCHEQRQPLSALAIAWPPEEEAPAPEVPLSLAPPRSRPLVAPEPTEAGAAPARRLAELEAAILAAAPITPTASSRRPALGELALEVPRPAEPSVRRLQTQLPGVVPPGAWPRGTDELPNLEALLAAPAPSPEASTRLGGTELPALGPEASTRRPAAEGPALAPEASTRRRTAELPALAPEASTRRPEPSLRTALAPLAALMGPPPAETAVPPAAEVSPRPAGAELPALAPEAKAPEAPATTPQALAPEASSRKAAPALQPLPEVRRLQPGGSSRGLYDEVDVSAWPNLAALLAAEGAEAEALAPSPHPSSQPLPPQPYRPVAAEDCPSCGHTAPAQSMVQCLTCGVAVCPSCHHQAEDGCPACARLEPVQATDPWLAPVLQVAPELGERRRRWSLARLGPYVVAHWSRWGAWGLVTVLLGEGGPERIVGHEVGRSAALWQRLRGEG